MYCFNCGSIVYNGEKFCRNCGVNLNDKNNFEKERVQNDEECLIDAYIGKNAEQFKNGGFSVCTFFFGIIYVLYRKMWLLGTLWFVGTVVASILLGDSASILSLIFNIYVSIKFKSWYYKHAREEVQKIKNNNVDASLEDLMKICRKKGGVAIWPIVVTCILYFLIFMLVIFIIIIAIIGYDSTPSDNSPYIENASRVYVDNIIY